MLPKLRRWAERHGTTVCWGNLVMGYRGQEFEETFVNEQEAEERERQATAGEAIGDARVPIAQRRIRIH